MEVISIINRKGGIGKTTTALSMTNLLKHLGYSVLLIDMAPQGNLSSTVRASMTPEDPLLYNCFNKQCGLRDAIQHTENCDVVPTDDSLDVIEPMLATRSGQDLYLRNMIYDSQSGVMDYDFVFIDTDPGMNLLVKNALVASDSVIVPCEPENYSLNGLLKMKAMVDGTREQYKLFNLGVKIDGILITKMTNKCKTHCDEYQEIQAVCKQAGLRPYETAIRDSKVLPASQTAKKPLIEYIYDPMSHDNGGPDYMNLTLEFLRLRGLEPKVDLPCVKIDSEGKYVYVRPKYQGKNSKKKVDSDLAMAANQ